METPSSASSSQHYSVLLQTVSELRNDLEKTMGKIRGLEEENETVKRNYNLVKDELIQTRGKYNEVKEGYLNAVSEKFEAERHNEAFMEKLKTELSEEKKKFDLIREKFVPHDIDQLRIKVQEELELQHREQLKALEYQLEQERAASFAMKRSYEKGKVEYEVLIQHQQQEVQTLREDREEVENNLRDQIVKLRDAELEPSKDEKLRAGRAQIAELTHLIELLREEAKTIRQERDEALFSLEQSKSSHEETVVHLKSRLAVAEAERVGMEEKLNHALVDEDRKDASIRSLRQMTEDSAARMEAATKQVADLEKSLLMTKDDHVRHLDRLQNAFDTERAEWVAQNDSLSNLLAEKEDALRASQREATETRTRMESSSAELRRAHQLQLQDARRKYASLEVEVAELKNNLKNSELSIFQQTEQSKAEIESLQSEMTRCQREKDLLQNKMRETELSLDGEKRKCSMMRQDLGLKMQALEGAVREAESKCASQEGKLSSAKDSLYEAQVALQTSKENGHRLEQKNVELLALIDSLNNDFKNQVEALGPSYREQSDKLKQKFKAALSKEKKRADAYKSKAVEAHAKVKSLISVDAEYAVKE